jgi:SEC-C motif-containing protein
MNCPCTANKLYSDCCQPLHKNRLLVPTAEKLMRSRYSAFALGLGKYLQETHHISTRPSNKEGKETEQWAKSVTWIKLEVNNTKKGQATDQEGWVSFKAFFMENGKINCIQEQSYFKKEDGWQYVEGSFSS